MAWQKTGDKPLPEPIMTRFLSLYGVTRPQWVNSPWPSDARCQHRSGSTLAQEMAHFLMAPSHYLNQSPLIISEVLWPAAEGNTVSQKILKTSIFDMNLKNNNLKLQPHLPCANDLRYFWPTDQGRQSSLDVWGPHAVSTQYGPIQWFMIMVFSGDLLKKTYSKFKPDYTYQFDKSTWKYLDKYQVFCLQVQVSTNYFWISECQVQVSTKYPKFCIKYQVQVLYLTPTLSTKHVSVPIPRHVFNEMSNVHVPAPWNEFPSSVLWL